ncbi:MAG TPA: preprotein translocase subunit SecG [Cryomorphaceae bacterium]|nr:preprotein translocase subunit SecG [Cryomorphaceae bacterium]HKL40372.1 preprotein translocase subunit SecG [Cryomorphaceae bacterium]
MQVFIFVLIILVCVFLALIVLIQNPKGGGLDSSFSSANQIGGVQRTADFLEKGTWSLAIVLFVLCLASAGLQDNSVVAQPGQFEEAAPQQQQAPAEEAPAATGTEEIPAEGEQ